MKRQYKSKGKAQEHKIYPGQYQRVGFRAYEGVLAVTITAVSTTIKTDTTNATITAPEKSKAHNPAIVRANSLCGQKAHCGETRGGGAGRGGAGGRGRPPQSSQPQ